MLLALQKKIILTPEALMLESNPFEAKYLLGRYDRFFVWHSTDTNVSTCYMSYIGGGVRGGHPHEGFGKSGYFANLLKSVF